MHTERTLIVDLDSRIGNSSRFNARSVREYFRNNSLDWWKPTLPPYLNQEKLISTWLERKHFGAALEIGPGFGRITKLIAPKTENLTLVEINEKAVGKLKKMFPSANVLESPAEEYAVWKGHYDLIAAVEILVHIPDVKRLLSSVAKSLNGEGIFITSITPDSFYKGKRTIIHRGINPDEIENAMKGSGLSIIEGVRNGQLLTYLAVKRRSF